MRNYQTRFLIEYFLTKYEIQSVKMTDLFDLLFSYKDVPVADVVELRQILRDLGYRRVVRESDDGPDIYWEKSDPGSTANEQVSEPVVCYERAS